MASPACGTSCANRVPERPIKRWQERRRMIHAGYAGQTGLFPWKEVFGDIGGGVALPVVRECNLSARELLTCPRGTYRPLGTLEEVDGREAAAFLKAV